MKTAVVWKYSYRPFCKIFLSILFYFILSVICSASEQDDTCSFDKSIEPYENAEYIVKECVRSNDELLALLVETKSETRQEQGQDNFLDLILYDKQTGDIFVPFSEPQVKLRQISALKSGGFTIQCASGNFFVGKMNGDWTLRGKGTPFGVGPQP